jgi:glycosyltransferase involved in cell wall biosynthesis
VGEGHRRAELEQLAADLGLTDAVTFAGHQTDVPAWIRRSALVVHASDYEGAATAVLEAMACGRGVVASALGGMDELVVRGVTGELCGDDPHEWASSIARALDARDRLGTAGRARAEDRFSAARMTASTLALYERILTEREYSV